MPSSSLAVWSYTLYYLEKRGKAVWKPCVASMLWRLPLERPLTGTRVLGCVPCPGVASTAVKGYSSNVWGALGTGLCLVLGAGDKLSQKDGSWAPSGQRQTKET